MQITEDMIVKIPPTQMWREIALQHVSMAHERLDREPSSTTEHIERTMIEQLQEDLGNRAEVLGDNFFIQSMTVEILARLVAMGPVLERVVEGPKR